MEKFKHTCPLCGQRIEYTVDYCGRQIACPSCQGNIVFPAIPPTSATQKLRLQRDIGAVKKKSLLDLAFLKAIVEFPHWKVVGACVIPFLLVGGLLLGATYLHKAGGDEPPAAIPAAVTAPVSSDAWKNMTDLGQVEQAVQLRLRNVALAKAASEEAERSRQILHAEGNTRNYPAADALVTLRQQQCNAARQSFDVAFEAYQKLGGRVDYRSQLPQ